MDEIIVIGHKNPDTDSICAAYCCAYLKNSISNNSRYIPARCGNVNKQTKFVFDRLKITLPVLINDILKYMT